MKFYPIINFNFGDQNLSGEDISSLYKLSIEVAAQAQVENLEFSLASDYIWENLNLILRAASEHKQKISFGSLTSLELAQDLIRIIGDAELEFFAPAFNSEVYKYLKNNSKCQYIPGVSSIKEFLSLFEKLSEQKGSQIKIFPFSCSSPQSLLKTLQAPYPELRRASLRSRVLTVSDQLASEYDIYSKIQGREDILLISSPTNYQKIREQFLINPKLKILLKPQMDNRYDLIDYIKAHDPSISIIITGFETKISPFTLHSSPSSSSSSPHLPYSPLLVDAYATRVFNNIILDYMSGDFTLGQVKDLMTRELIDISCHSSI